MRQNFSVPVIALLVGAGIGFAMHPSAKQTESAEPTAEQSSAPAHIADAGAEASVEALRSRVKELEALLANEAAKAAANGESAQNAPSPREERRGFFNPREMMERLKAEDPEEYANMTNRMAKFRQRRLDRANSKIEFFSSIDLSNMGEDAQETHARLQSMIAKREEVEERLHSETISDEERESAMREMFDMEHQMRDLYRKERSNLITETVTELGLTGEDAEDVAALIGEIYEMTSTNFGPPHGGPGGPGGRHRRDGRR